MSAPRLEIDLDKIGHNARVLVAENAAVGISVTAVTKAFLGLPALARVLLDAGATALGDSRIENVETMQSAGIDAPMLLIRSPMPSQVQRVVDSGVVSANSELDVLELLSGQAVQRGIDHGVMLMVELGDLREGIMGDRLLGVVAGVLALPHLVLRGIGANLACRNGVVPDDLNMAELSAHADAIEAQFGVELGMISGGNSANLDWALGSRNPGSRVNNLRLGEAILLGREPLGRTPIAGLFTDTVTLVGEVIESIRKPLVPWGQMAQAAFGETAAADATGETCGAGWQTIVAIGHQDTDPGGLQPSDGCEILGASSDHLVLATDRRMRPGTEVSFQPNYSALLRSTTSPFVAMTVDSQPVR